MCTCMFSKFMFSKNIPKLTKQWHVFKFYDPDRCQGVQLVRKASFSDLEMCCPSWGTTREIPPIESNPLGLIPKGREGLGPAHPQICDQNWRFQWPSKGRNWLPLQSSHRGPSPRTSLVGWIEELILQFLKLSDYIKGKHAQLHTLGINPTVMGLGQRIPATLDPGNATDQDGFDTKELVRENRLLCKDLNLQDIHCFGYLQKRKTVQSGHGIALSSLLAQTPAERLQKGRHDIFWKQYSTCGFCTCQASRQKNANKIREDLGMECQI